MSVVRQGPRARFRRAALASVAVHPHGQGVSVPGPACNATRHGSTSLNTGGFPGCRVDPRRSRAAVASPFGLTEPASGSEWPVVPSAGRLPARHRGDRDTALDCAFRRPRRLQPTTLPVAALWRAAPYHPVTKASRAIFLANPLWPLAARPLLPPVTTRSPQSTPSRRPGSDRRQPHQPRPGAAPTRADLRRPCSPPNDTYSACSLPSLSQSVRRARASRADLTSARQVNRSKRRLRP